MPASEIGVLAQALRRHMAVVAIILVVSAGVGALLGRGGPTTYRAAAELRLQYPRSLETVPSADDFAAWMRDDALTKAAASRAGVASSDFSLTAAVPPSNRRLVTLAVNGPGRDQARDYLQALVDAGRDRAERTVGDQMRALRLAAQANKKALVYAERVAKRAEELVARTTDDPLAQATALGLAMQANSGKAGLLDEQASIAAQLTQLEQGVAVQSGPSVSANPAGGGPVAGAARGGIAGAALVIVWLLAATRRERAVVREA